MMNYIITHLKHIKSVKCNYLIQHNNDIMFNNNK